MAEGAWVNANGILFIDKPEGWTSHDVVARARRALGTRKVGHAGTLDPMATGLLTLGAGPSTRLLTHLVGLDKTYTATIRLGVQTVTDDREGETLATASADTVDRVTHDDILREVAKLTGPIEQKPSQVSAVKIDGKRAYDRVRAGEDVDIPARPVTVHSFEIHEPQPLTLPSGERVIDLEATVRCSSGTYIRALARDLGTMLGIGGHLTRLRRVAVGPFSLERPAFTVATTENMSPVQLVPPATIARALFPVLELTDDEAIALGHGKRLTVEAPDEKLVAAIAPDERLIGLIEVKRGTTRVVTNFPTPDSGQSQ